MSLRDKITMFFDGESESLIGSMLSYGFTNEELDQAERLGYIEYLGKYESIVYNKLIDMDNSSNEVVSNATIIKAFNKIKVNQVMFAKGRGAYEQGIVIFEKLPNKPAVVWIKSEEPSFYLYDRILHWQNEGKEIIFI